MNGICGVTVTSEDRGQIILKVIAVMAADEMTHLLKDIGNGSMEEGLRVLWYSGFQHGLLVGLGIAAILALVWLAWKWFHSGGANGPAGVPA